MQRPTIIIKKRLIFFLTVFTVGITVLIIRLGYLQIVKAEFLQAKAKEQQTRDRLIAPQRGTIYDRNGIPLATNASVSTISVIHNQIKDAEKVSSILSEKLDLDYDEVKKKVDKVVALERIQSRVDNEIADEIRAMNLAGVAIDEDSKRYYPYRNLAAHVIGFVGKDNQGIVGLEVKYDQYLKGMPGKILTETDARGHEIHESAEKRIEPTPGNHLITSIDVIIQQYAEQVLETVVEAKQAKRGALIIMNPQNGEIYAMANKPDYDLNEPFVINEPLLKAQWSTMTGEEKNKALNHMWRNFSINDTYEPGSTFKIVTATAGLQEDVVHLDDTFNCPGYRIVADRRIRCHKAGGHGLQTFIQGVQNSCNPVFMDIGERLGAATFQRYMKDFGFDEKTGIDVPGEAVGIMHKLKDIGPVELATMSFGQSFQITPLQLMRAASAVVNGGYLITPHFGLKIINQEEKVIKELQYKNGKQVVSKEVSDTMRHILETVVSEGTGHRTYIPGYKIGGKTATSEKLPRSSNKYISSFLGFAPADHPEVMALLLIDEPQGIYYGGTVAAPVVKEVFENILPYLNIEPRYSEKELEMDGVGDIVINDYRNQKISEIKKELQDVNVTLEILGEGKYVKEQFPLPGEHVNENTKLILYVEEEKTIDSSHNNQLEE